MIIIKFYGYYREALNLEKVEVEDVKTLKEAFEKLKKLLREKSDILFEEGDILKKNLLLAVNNTIVKSDDLENEKIFDGDIISIMPLPSGG